MWNSIPPSGTSLFQGQCHDTMAPVGIDVRTVQEWLDQESLATTQKYLEGNGKALEG
jgi:hypothetical protein